MCQSFLVLFFKKEPLSLPLAFRGADLHTWAVTQKTQKPLPIWASLSGDRLGPDSQKFLPAFLRCARIYPADVAVRSPVDDVQHAARRIAEHQHRLVSEIHAHHRVATVSSRISVCVSAITVAKAGLVS